MTDYRLSTASYRRFKPEMGLPVQASNGAPKYPLSYEIGFNAKPIYPRWQLVKADLTEIGFRDAYWRDLDRIGVVKLSTMFANIAAVSDSTDLVLLCFEELTSGQFCHRRHFAQWWLENTGEEVPEHGPTDEPALF